MQGQPGAVSGGVWAKAQACPAPALSSVAPGSSQGSISGRTCAVCKGQPCPRRSVTWVCKRKMKVSF